MYENSGGDKAKLGAEQRGRGAARRVCPTKNCEVIFFISCCQIAKQTVLAQGSLIGTEL